MPAGGTRQNSNDWIRPELLNSHSRGVDGFQPGNDCAEVRDANPDGARTRVADIQPRGASRLGHKPVMVGNVLDKPADSASDSVVRTVVDT